MLINNELTSFFTNPIPKKVLISDEEIAEGGIFAYLPHKGEVGIRSNVYTLQHLDHPYLRYLFQQFGQPDIHFLSENDLDVWEDAAVMSIDFTSSVVTQAQRVGSTVKDIYALINNKEHFQKLVQRVLGNEYSTDPVILPQGSPLVEVAKAVGALQQDGHAAFVLRVADARIGESGGHGVRFIFAPHEVIAALTSIPHLVQDDYIQSSVLVERLIPSVGSPSTTFFLGEKEVLPLSVNSQILHHGTFMAGTNILPDRVLKHQHDLEEKGLILAKSVQQQGGRGFFGVDWIVGESIVAVEANYRETGTTSAALWTQKAVHFSRDRGWAEWIQIVELPYNTTIKNIEHLLHFLQEKKMLYMKETATIDTTMPLCIPAYGMSTEIYNLLVFWEKGSIPPATAYEKVNTLLGELGTDFFIPGHT